MLTYVYIYICLHARTAKPGSIGGKANQSPGTRSSVWCLTSTTRTGTRGESRSPPAAVKVSRLRPSPAAVAVAAATATTKTRAPPTLPPPRPQPRSPQPARTLLLPPPRFQGREVAQAKQTPTKGAVSPGKSQAPLLPHKQPGWRYRPFWEERRGRDRDTAWTRTGSRSGCGSGRGRTRWRRTTQRGGFPPTAGAAWVCTRQTRSRPGSSRRTGRTAEWVCGYLEYRR